MSQNPLRVVIAEDEALIRLDLKEMLEEEGYSVVAEAGDGEPADGDPFGGGDPVEHRHLDVQDGQIRAQGGHALDG